MLEVFIKRIDLLAFACALEPQVHEDILQNLVLLVERIDLVTDSAFEFAVWNIFAGCFRKQAQAILAT